MSTKFIVSIFNLAGVAFMVAVLAYTLNNRDIFLVSPRYAVAYYWVPAALAVILVASLAFNTVVRANVVLLFLGLLAAALGADIWIAQFQRKAELNPRTELARGVAARRGIPFDERTMMQVVKEFRSEGAKTIPMMSPSNFIDYGKAPDRSGMEIKNTVVLPMGSMSRARNVYCNEGGRWLVYDSDEYGFQNPVGTWAARQANVALVGDSFAQGACNPVETGVAHALRERFGKVVNIGIGGSGPLLQFGAMKEYLPLVKPKKVIWLHFEGNDMFTNLPQEKRHPILQRYLKETGFVQRLPEIQDAIDENWMNFLRGYEGKINGNSLQEASAKHPPLSNSLKLITLRDRFGLTTCPKRSQDFELLGEIVEKADKLVRGWGGQLVFVYLPSWGGCDLFDPRNKNNWLHNKVIETVSSKQVPIIDIGPIFANHSNMESLFHYRGSHYSPDGYKLVFQTITDAILGSRP